MTLPQLIEEMVEFGVCLEEAERNAPMLLPFFNDPRGFARAFVEDCPELAERLGVVRRQ